MNILMIHGVNTNEDASPNPYSYWETAIQTGLTGAGYAGPFNFTRVDYNDIFDKHPSNILVSGLAVVELVASVIQNAVSVPRPGVMAVAPPQPGDDFTSELRWTAGMVAQWVVEDGLRSDCRDRLVQQITAANPDLIFAHSLGTLLTYDLFVNDPRGKTIFNKTLITFGTQIGNPFVKDKMWGGNVGMINVGMWYNLYNPNDPVFVAPVGVTAANFHQFTTVFGDSFLDLTGHDVTVLPTCSHPGYLDNPTTDANLWPALSGGTMARLLARNIQILQRAPQSTSPASSMMLAAALGRRGPRRKVPHTYRYHPPRADHPLLKSAPKLLRPAVAAPLPPAMDLRNFCKPIRDQGSEGSCSGFSTAAFREASHAAAARGALLPDYLAPAYLYARTRIEDGTFPADSGASIADEFLILQNYGVCPESDMPYDANPTEAPTPADDVAAQPFRLPQPLQVDFKDPVALKSVLAGNQTITIGFTVYDSFESPDANGVVPMPNTATEKMLGGHGVLVCGYDDTNNWWIIRNSWSTDWGAGGYCYMPYGYESLWTEAWTGVATL